jgi:hypothetical protein
VAERSDTMMLTAAQWPAPGLSQPQGLPGAGPSAADRQGRGGRLAALDTDIGRWFEGPRGPTDGLCVADVPLCVRWLRHCVRFVWVCGLCLWHVAPCRLKLARHCIADWLHAASRVPSSSRCYRVGGWSTLEVLRRAPAASVQCLRVGGWLTRRCLMPSFCGAMLCLQYLCMARAPGFGCCLHMGVPAGSGFRRLVSWFWSLDD